MSLKQKAFSGIKATSVSTIGTALIQIVQISILARYLNATDFGLMAIIMVVIGFGQLFADMGISNGIIHKQYVSEVQLSTLYWINIIVSFIVFSLIMILAPFIASFYNDVNLKTFVMLTSIVLIIQAFGQQFQILLQKELQFYTLSIIELLSKFIGLIVAVTFAMLDYGIYALIYASISSVVVKTVLLVKEGLSYHRPLFVFNLSETKFFINFGLYQMGERMIYFFNTQIDVILIGKLLGNETLGLYSLAKQFVMRPAGILTPVLGRVMFPVMSKVQNDISRLKNMYLKTINVLSSLIFPMYGLIIIFAPEIIQIFFGGKWNSMVPILQILSVYAAIRSVGNFTGPLVLATGRIKRSFYWNLVNLAIFPVAVFFGSQWDIYGVAVTLVILQGFLIVPNWKIIIYPLTKAKLIEYLNVMFKPLFLVIFVSLIIFVFLTSFNFYGVRILGFISFILIMLLVYILFNRGFLNMLKEFIFTRKIKI